MKILKRRSLLDIGPDVPLQSPRQYTSPHNSGLKWLGVKCTVTENPPRVSRRGGTGGCGRRGWRGWGREGEGREWCPRRISHGFIHRNSGPPYPRRIQGLIATED